MEANLSEPEDYVRDNFVEACVPLRDMNDVQIEKYIEIIGRCPRGECNEWRMGYTGGNILRYSYCEFIQWGIEDQTVTNITITRARFDEINFDNCVFDGVEFKNCVFKIQVPPPPYSITKQPLLHNQVPPTPQPSPPDSSTKQPSKIMI